MAGLSPILSCKPLKTNPSRYGFSFPGLRVEIHLKNEFCVADIRAWESNQVVPIRFRSRGRAGRAHGVQHEQASQPGKSYRKDHQRCADQERRGCIN